MQSAARATKAERRMSQPAPCYGYRPGETAMRITIEAPGWAIGALLIVPDEAARSDQFAVEQDGKRMADVMGLTAVFDMLRKQVPRRLNRRLLASL